MVLELTNLVFFLVVDAETCKGFGYVTFALM